MTPFEGIIATIFVLIIMLRCGGAFNDFTSNDISRVPAMPYFDLENYRHEFLGSWTWDVCYSYAVISYFIEEGKFIGIDDLEWHLERVDEIRAARKEREKEKEKYKFKEIDKRRKVFEQKIKPSGDNKRKGFQATDSKKNIKKNKIEWIEPAH